MSDDGSRLIDVMVTDVQTTVRVTVEEASRLYGLGHGYSVSIEDEKRINEYRECQH